MHTIGGLTPTGRKLRGPASDLVELDAPNGLKHTAIVFHPEHRDHNGINDALSVVLGFLESPMVSGIIELVGHDQPEGAFLYPTGQVWSLKEVVTALYDRGEVGGVRAGLELMYVAGEILKEASDTGASQGVYSHGGLTPWRIMLRKDGQVQIIGYALPQVEILQFSADPSVKPQTDSFRYCPPERVVYAAEDLSSDLFSLALIAFELMTGKPVYDGLVDEIRQQAARAEGSKRLFRFRDKLPQAVRDLLGQVLRLEQRDRYTDGDSFLSAVSRVLSSPDATGPSLIDVMGSISSMVPRAGAVVDSASTSMGTPEQFRKMLGEDEAPADGPVRRSFTAPPPARGPAPPPAAPAPASAPPRAPTAAPPASPPPAASPDLEALKRSGVRRAAPSAAAALSSSGGQLSAESAAAPRWSAGPPRRGDPGADLGAPAIHNDPDAILEALSASRSRGARAPVRLRAEDDAPEPPAAAGLSSSGRFGAPARARPPEEAPAAPAPAAPAPAALASSGRFGAPARARAPEEAPAPPAPGAWSAPPAASPAAPPPPAPTPPPAQSAAQRILDEIVRSSGGQAAGGPPRGLRRAPPREAADAVDPAASTSRPAPRPDEAPRWAPPLPSLHAGPAPDEAVPEHTVFEGPPVAPRAAPPALPVAAGPGPSFGAPPAPAAFAPAPPPPAFSPAPAAAAPPPPAFSPAPAAAAPPPPAFSPAPAAAPPPPAFSPAPAAAAPPPPAFSPAPAAAAPPPPAFPAATAAAPPPPAFSPAPAAAAPPPPAFSPAPAAAAPPPPAFSPAPPSLPGSRGEPAAPPRAPGLPIAAGPAPAPPSLPPPRPVVEDDDEDDEDSIEGDPHSTRLMARPSAAEPGARMRMAPLPAARPGAAPTAPPAAAAPPAPPTAPTAPAPTAPASVPAPVAPPPAPPAGSSAPSAAAPAPAAPPPAPAAGPAAAAPAAPSSASAAGPALVTEAAPPHGARAPAGAQGAARLDRAPDPMAAAAAAGGAASFSVRRGPGGRPTRLRLPLSATSAEAVTWMIGNLVPVKLSLTGALVGWYRLSNGRGRVGHNVLMSALDVNEELSLELVENQTLFCDLLVEQNGARSLSPCGSAVPVGSLTDHLCAWMGLPAGAYTLLVDDVDVGPYAILADLPAPARGEVHRLRLVGPR